MAINPMSIVESGYKAYDQAQSEEERALAIAQQRLALKEAQATATERARTPQTLTLGAPAVPGIAAGPNAAPAGGGPLLSLEEAPQGMSPGVPARIETLTEFPRHETPMQFEQRRRQEQARVDTKQADAEALDRFNAGDLIGFHNARARAYGHAMDAVDEPHRAAMMRNRNDELNAAVELRRRGITRHEVAPKLMAKLKELEKHPENRQPWWDAQEILLQSDDPEILKPGMEWLQNDLKAYKARRLMTEQGQAIGTVEELLLRKQVERGNAKIALDETEYRKIALEVIQELPNEVGIYNEAMLTTKGPVPGMFMRLFHPELSGPKEFQLSQRAMQDARTELGPNADPAAVAALADQKYALFKRGETPAAQDMKLRLQEQTLKLQEERTGKERAIAQYYRERASGGATGVKRETLHALAMSRDLFAKRLDALPQSQWTEAERVEQAKILKQDITDLDTIIQQHAAAMKGADYGTKPRPTGPTTSPTRPVTPLAAVIAKRAHELWQRDPNPNKGRWEDPTVADKYRRQVEAQTP